MQVSTVLLHLTVPLILASLVLAGGAIVGGQTPQDVNSADIQELAAQVVSKYNAQSNSVYYNGLYKIVKATSQVVAGVIYRLTLQLAPTNCPNNNQIQSSQNCEFNTNKITVVNAEIYERPWENFTQITFKD